MTKHQDPDHGTHASVSEDGDPAQRSGAGSERSERPETLSVGIGSKSAADALNPWENPDQKADPEAVTPSLRRVLADRARVLIAETCGDLPEAKQTRYCGVYVTKGLSDVAVEHHPKGYAYTTGLQTCSSVWVCPICSFKVRQKRAAEIAQAIARHHERGGTVLLLTLTTSHGHGDSLGELWDTVQDCWAYITSHSRYRKLKRRYGLGFIRAMEVMHGLNGWHPHLHVLLFSDVELDVFDTRAEYHELGRVFHDLWIGRMREKHGREVRSSYGVDLRMVKGDDAAGVGVYCTKAGYEVAMADGKEGRTRTSRHPFAIAYDAVETGDTASVTLFREWVQGCHGRKMWSWSEGLRERSGLDIEKTDEELASEADESVGQICLIEAALWALIARTRFGLRSQFLSALDVGARGLDAAIQILIGNGLAVSVETRSLGRAPRLRSPDEPETKPTNNRENQNHV